MARLSAYLSNSSGGVLHHQLAEPWAVKVRVARSWNQNPTVGPVVFGASVYVLVAKRPTTFEACDRIVGKFRAKLFFYSRLVARASRPAFSEP